jgi:hypothetical protein
MADKDPTLVGGWSATTQISHDGPTDLDREREDPVAASLAHHDA